MRIQHNIPAMNAYRNYNNNTKALQGNLQKLSSGYKINKAGDDAAGLAISEKMRAQITGLEVAQKNAKDGISLVQTAEGALTEVHTMLNRMYSLAEQSANGTYQNEVDRDQLQKEVQSLSEEIDRISKATNFNGQKLLDGTLAGSGSSSSGSSGAITTSLSTTTVEATKAKYVTGAITTATNLDTKATTVTLAFADENGNDKVVEFSFTSGAHSNGTTADAGKGIYLDVNGQKEWVGDVGTAHGIGATEWSSILTKAFDKVAPELKNDFTISSDATNGALTLTAKEAGTGTMALKTCVTNVNATAANIAVTETKGVDAFDAINLKDIATNNQWDGTAANLEKSIFEVDGKKFVIYANGVTLDDEKNALLAEAGVGNNAVKYDTSVQNTLKGVVTAINQATGLAVEQGNINSTTGAWTKANAAVTDTYIALKSNTAQVGSKGSGGLTLQIGDTADDYNKMTVSIKNCNSASIGIGSVDISKQEGASTAMTAIKDAINYISDVRGTLGSLQNRLDHTINNLSVQQENIQDAEATIRDVDVANEMMAYTKNNILVQSAQAMLAQANQLPQGVLQLLG